ncbi:hypothetical protein [Paenibacillus thalictri]|uniref:Spore coat protein D n=1 Tax=Paenibacillus thalictri TaxID=2527873 RepID=A0A4Q9DKK0_9BACL|nr:hypothetical protein [Paenibacillus thalictri]TBL75321.1 hypothetical protein EYB31_23210 [Paenibacillus thalictri]
MSDFCPTCPAQTVVDPPVTYYQNYFHPQVVTVVHPIEVVNQHHCVPVPHHVYAYSEKDVMCSSVRSRKHAKKTGVSSRKRSVK